VAGTIDRKRVASLERVLWRVLRENMFMNHTNIDKLFVDWSIGEETNKDVFIIFAHSFFFAR
jgi:V-type H+-transporting ATPase subunit a